MKLARILFSIAGALGILAMIPMYMAPGSYRYYGSLGGLVAWQFTFFLIATDPKRYRPVMIPALMEKLLWVLTLIAIYMRGGMTSAEVIGGTIPHALLGLLFVLAFLKTRVKPASTTIV